MILFPFNVIHAIPFWRILLGKYAACILFGLMVGFKLSFKAALVVKVDQNFLNNSKVSVPQIHKNSCLVY
jgi:hypothetical protein